MLLTRPAHVPAARRGSALLMAFLVLIVLVAILFQLYIGTTTDARVARNDSILTAMDQAIESALLEVNDRLLTDAESSAAAGAAGAGAAASDAADPSAATASAPDMTGGQQSEPSDSREDSWGRVQRTTINEIELRILVQDEDSKINVLSLLTDDEEQAAEALERVARVLDLCREDSSADIDRSEARRLAEAIRDHLHSRALSVLPRAALLSDDEDQSDRGLPLSLREMVAIEPFHTGLFRDFRDDRGRVVHGIESFLTVWSSLQPLSQMQPSDGQNGNPSADPQDDADPAQQAGSGNTAAPGVGPLGGVAVNINTAPAAVLKALLDDRVIPNRFWDEVIEYRNLEEEQDDDVDQAEPVFDEYGDEVYARRFFDSVAELEELDAYQNIGAEDRLELSQMIATQSHVFSIYITGRRATGQQDQFGGVLGAQRRGEKQDTAGNAITRTVRSVVWRFQDGDTWKIIPLSRWEVVDYTPFEVLDYPDPDR